jgi:AcrR family transcriptional regulator
MSDTSPIEDSARARILDAAVQEIAQHGFAAARVDAIARAAGVNKQLIYYYFESKSGLREAVLVEMVRSYKPFWERVDQSTLPAILDVCPVQARARSGLHGDASSPGKAWSTSRMRTGRSFWRSRVARRTHARPKGFDVNNSQATSRRT